jgi:Hemerythrin HHE cation binding domain
MTAKRVPRANTSDMVAVHRVFRETLGAADALITPVAPDDLRRVAVLGNFYNNVLMFLAAHDAGEDEVVFPLLRERCPDDVECIDRVSGKHREIEEMINSSRESLIAWAAGDGGAQDRAAKSLTELGVALGANLDEEEAQLLPLCAAHITGPEWGALPAHGVEKFGGDKMWLILGLIRDRCTQAQRGRLLAQLPGPTAEAWTSFGEDAYRSLLADIGPPLG